ncbi:MAG: hypothetical protein AAF670_19705, partial [Planctomycetota bacterium]
KQRRHRESATIDYHTLHVRCNSWQANAFGYVQTTHLGETRIQQPEQVQNDWTGCWRSVAAKPARSDERFVEPEEAIQSSPASSQLGIVCTPFANCHRPHPRQHWFLG